MIKLKKIANELAPHVQAYMHARLLRHFDESSKGGTFRNVEWPYFRPWYTTEDGKNEVMPWGQPGSKGKLRSKHKGTKKRYRPGALLMQNTGLLKGGLVADVEISSTEIKLITPIKYADQQNKLRPFNFFTATELLWIQKKANSILAKRIKE